MWGGRESMTCEIISYHHDEEEEDGEEEDEEVEVGDNKEEFDKDGEED